MPTKVGLIISYAAQRCPAIETSSLLTGAVWTRGGCVGWAEGARTFCREQKGSTMQLLPCADSFPAMWGWFNEMNDEADFLI